MQNNSVPKNWWSRNWKWAVPAGCLTLCVLWIVAVSALIYSLFALMKTSEVYTLALEKVKGNSQVILSTGHPVKEGWYMMGSIHIDGLSGDADISFPVSGPKGSGKVFVIATKSNGTWVITTLLFENEKGERIDILDQQPVKVLKNVLVKSAFLEVVFAHGNCHHGFQVTEDFSNPFTI